MAETDNEELESLKRWWAANATSLILGALLGVAVIAAWQGWRWYTDTQAEAAANTYAQVSQRIADDKINDGVLDGVARLKSDYSATPYAAAAALDLAAYYVAQQQYDQAIAQLDWAAANADSRGMRSLARVRKARLVWTQGKPEAALALLDHDHPKSFDALYAELTGDIQAAQGNRAAAYKAYQHALDTLPPDTPQRHIEQKLANNAPRDTHGAAAGADRSSTDTASPS